MSSKNEPLSERADEAGVDADTMATEPPILADPDGVVELPELPEPPDYSDYTPPPLEPGE